MTPEEELDVTSQQAGNSKALQMPEGEAEEPNGINSGDDEDFDIQENEDGSATLIPKESDEPTDPEEQEFDQNLVEFFLDKSKASVLTGLATDYIHLVEVDKLAREKRDRQYAEAIQRSGLGEPAPGGADFEGANKVTHPLISEATVDFAARAIKELCPPDGPVKTHILGKVTPEKTEKADRKQRHMNWQLTTQMPEFRPALEQIFTQLALSGVQYSKTYHWKRGRRNKFEFIPMEDVFIPFHAADFYSATRRTHRQKLTEIEYDERIASGLYHDWDIDSRTDAMIDEQSAAKEASDKVEGKEDPMYDEDGLRTVYEIYCWLDLEDDPLAQGDYSYAPYIMSIDGPTEKVLAIYRNWEQSDATMAELDWLIAWSFVPWRGAYDIGLGQLIGSLAGAATGALRALLDSAHTNNVPTGLKLKGASIGGQSDSIGVGQIREIDGAPGVDDIRKIFMPMPFNPPSPVLLELLGIVVEYGKGVVRTAIESDQNYSPNMPVGTELSRVEQGMAVYSAIHARLHNSMKRQLAIVHRLNSVYLEENKQQTPYGEAKEHKADVDDETSIPLAFKEDYQGEMDVQPVSDPNIFSEAQRISQMQAVGALIQQSPQIYDVRAYHKRMLQLLKIPGIDELMPEPPAPEDENPATENIKMAFGQPAFVLPNQNHLAHIQVHCDFMKNPLYGGNPAIAPKFMAQAVNHLVQHLLFLYGDEIKLLIEQAAGQPIKELLGDEPQLMELMSKTVAAASPQALENAEGLLKDVMPVLMQAFQQSQQYAPKPPMDPGQAQLQAANIKAQSDAEKAKQDNQIREQQMLSEEKIAADKNKTELQKNQEDNNTALAIAAMRVETGGSVGGIKNGTSLGASYADGGLVGIDGQPLRQHLAEGGTAGEDIRGQVLSNLLQKHRLDLSPIIEAIKGIPQPDMSPVIDAINRNAFNAHMATHSAPKMEMPSFTPETETQPAEKFNNEVDLSPVTDELKNHTQVMTTGMSDLLQSHEKMMDGINKGHQKILKALDKKPKKAKITIARDKGTGALSASIDDGSEDDAPEPTTEDNVK